jgi:protein subunit release factor A
MEKIEEEYSAALEKLIRVKEEVAAGDKTLDDLDEAMAEVRHLKEKRKMLQDADRLVEEGAELDVEEDPEEESEEDGPDFDDINEALDSIIDEIGSHKDPKHEQAYIIGFKSGSEARMCAAGDRASLLAMFVSLKEQKPFCDIKPLDAKARKEIKKFIEKLK